MRRRDGMRLTLLAGWLFADLLLVLTLIGLADLPAKPAGSGETSSPAPTPTPAASVRPGALEHLPVSFDIEISPAAFRDSGRATSATRDLISRLHQKIAERGRRGRRVGFVVVLASGGDIGLAKSTAQKVVRVLRDRDPDVFGGSSGLGYWTGSGDHLEFQVFFFSG